MIPIPDNHHLVVVRSELDMTVALLLHRVQRPHLVLASVPVDFEKMLLLVLAQDLVQPIHDFLVGAPLERDRLALVVETWRFSAGSLDQAGRQALTEIKQQADLDAAAASLLDGPDNGSRVQRRRLAVMSVSL